MEPNAWDGEVCSISVFGTMEFLEIDMKNIFMLLLHIANYIKNKKVEKGKINDMTELKEFSKTAWSFISSIYESEWNSLYTDKENRMFRQKFVSKFTPKVSNSNIYSNSSKSKEKSAEIAKISPLIPARPSKEVLEKSKFFKKGKKSATTVKLNNKHSYAQVVNSKVNDILKLKEDYPNLPAKKIKNIHKIINDSDKPKSRIKMTTKDSIRKQIIIPIGNENKIKFIASSSNHVVSLNRAFKNIRLNIMADYIHIEQNSITIVTNKVALFLDLQVIENYVKNIKNINFKDIISFTSIKILFENNRYSIFYGKY